MYMHGYDDLDTSCNATCVGIRLARGEKRASR
jgi:hypothetical protein